jgi:hypothetical protein
MQNVTSISIAALGLELAPAALFGLLPEGIARAVARWPAALRVSVPALLVAPYALVSLSLHTFRWEWFAFYSALPVAIAWLLMRAATADPQQRGDWRDAFILLVLGLAVDLRWFDGAWPSGLRALNELLLVDAGLYGFLAIRQLSDTGFDFHLKWSDWKTGFRELAPRPSLSHWDWRWASSTRIETSRESAAHSCGGWRYFSLPLCRKSSSFAPGYRTCWSDASGVAQPS